MQYVELHCKSNFSFLTGASHPDELVERASELGYRGLALTDESSIAGAVRGHAAAKDLELQYIVGTEIHLTDAPSARKHLRGQIRADDGHTSGGFQIRCSDEPPSGHLELAHREKFWGDSIH